MTADPQAHNPSQPKPSPSPRDHAITAFLGQAGWGQARRAALAGDASNRRYERLTQADGSRAVLMDADPARGEEVAPFLAIARILALRGLRAPQIFAQDTANGLLLLEDFGDSLFARVMESQPDETLRLYAAATDTLTHLHGAPLPAGIARYDGALMGDRAALALRWYRQGILGDSGAPEALADLIAQLKARLAPQDSVLALRDFHAENLIWLPGAEGVARVGLLDFQDALAAPRAYDLVSLLQDARRDVDPGIEGAMLAHYARANGLDAGAFAAEYAFCGAQRALRILGVFARLCMHYAKPGYLALIPRVWQALERDLAHPALAPLAKALQGQLPAPTPQALERIASQCGQHPLP